MFGRVPRLPIDVTVGVPSQNRDTQPYSVFVEDLRARLAYTYDLASRGMEKKAVSNKLRYDSRAQETSLQPGDRVLVRNLTLRGKHKLQDRWEDTPYQVIRRAGDLPVYWLRKEGTRRERVLHRNLLLPFRQPEADPCEARPRVLTGSRIPALQQCLALLLPQMNHSRRTKRTQQCSRSPLQAARATPSSILPHRPSSPNSMVDLQTQTKPQMTGQMLGNWNNTFPSRILTRPTTLRLVTPKTLLYPQLDRLSRTNHPTCSQPQRISRQTSGLCLIPAAAIRRTTRAAPLYLHWRYQQLHGRDGLRSLPNASLLILRGVRRLLHSCP